MYYVSTPLGQWILNELEVKSWSQNELGRRASLSSGTISNIINGTTKPDQVTLRSISKAFKVSAETVLRLAGLLPEAPAPTAQTEQLLYLFDQMDDKNRQTILDMMNFLLSK